MHVGIINSVLYIRFFAKGQEQGHTTLFFVFFHTRPQAHFDAKSNVLHINGKGYAKENIDLCQFGLHFTVTNKYHTRDNLRSLQSSIIALRT